MADVDTRKRDAELIAFLDDIKQRPAIREHLTDRERILLGDSASRLELLSKREHAHQPDQKTS